MSPFGVNGSKINAVAFRRVMSDPVLHGQNKLDGWTRGLRLVDTDPANVSALLSLLRHNVVWSRLLKLF